MGTFFFWRTSNLMQLYGDFEGKNSIKIPCGGLASYDEPCNPTFVF